MKTNKILRGALFALVIGAGLLAAGCNNDTTNGSNVPVTGVTITPNQHNIAPGNTATITVNIQPAAAVNKNVNLTVAPPGIITLDRTSGIGEYTITAVEEGEALITAVTAEGGHTATAAVTVAHPVPPTTITITGNSEAPLPATTTRTLTLAFTPSNANTSVTWTSDTPAVATVSDGVVTGVKEGTAAITVQSTLAPSVQATVEITVGAPPPSGDGTVGQIHFYTRYHQGTTMPWYFDETTKPETITGTSNAVSGDGKLATPYIIGYLPVSQSVKINADVVPTVSNGAKGALTWTARSPRTATVTVKPETHGWDAEISAVSPNGGDAQTPGLAIFEVSPASGVGADPVYVAVHIVEKIATINWKFDVTAKPVLGNPGLNNSPNVMTTDTDPLWLSTATAPANRNTAKILVTLDAKDAISSGHDVILSDLGLKFYYNGSPSLPLTYLGAGIPHTYSGLSVTASAASWDLANRTVELTITAGTGSGTHVIPDVSSTSNPQIKKDTMAITVESLADPTMRKHIYLRVVPHVTGAQVEFTPSGNSFIIGSTPSPTNATRTATITSLQPTNLDPGARNPAPALGTFMEPSPGFTAGQPYKYTWEATNAGSGWQAGEQASSWLNISQNTSRGPSLTAVQVTGSRRINLKLTVEDRAGHKYENPTVLSSILITSN